MIDNTTTLQANKDRRRRGEDNGGGRWGGFPTRYRLATLGALGLLCTVGFRKSFAIVLTHITAEQDSAASQELFFPNCTVFNTSRDLYVPMGEDTMFLLHSAYYAGSPFSAIFSAVLATRVSPVYVIGAAVTVSSVTTIALPFILQASVPCLFVLRMLQGGIDGAQRPCTIGMLSAWSTGSDKARLCSIYYTGAYLAPALAALLSGVTICYISWNSILLAYGVCGVVWSVVWVARAYDTPGDHPSLSYAEAELHRTHGPDVHYHKLSEEEKEQHKPDIPWQHILTSPTVWSVTLGMFCHTHVYSMLVVEQAQYFSDSFNIQIADIGLLTTLPHLGLSASCLMGGFASDKLLHYGLSTTFTRKLLFSIGKLIEGACLLGLYVASDWQTAITLITLGVSVGGLAEAGYQPIPADLSTHFAGVISAFTAIGAIGAFANTFVTSFILGNGKTLKDWQTVFLISGLLDLITVVVFDIMATAEPQPWGSGEPLTTTTTPTTGLSTLKAKCLPSLSDNMPALLQKLRPHRERAVACESTALILPKTSLGGGYSSHDGYSSDNEG